MLERQAKIWASEVTSIYIVHVTLGVSRSCWRHSVPLHRMACNSKICCSSSGTDWHLTLAWRSSARCVAVAPGVCVAEEGRCLVGLVHCLGGLARRVDDRTTFPLVASESGGPGLASVESADSHPAESPTAKAFYSGRSGSLQVSNTSHPSFLSLSYFPQQRPVAWDSWLVTKLALQDEPTYIHLQSYNDRPGYMIYWSLTVITTQNL